MKQGPLVVLGDSLLDRDLEGTVERLCPDAPVPVVDQPGCHSRPGGSALAAALAAGGTDVVLVTALADDDAGRELAGLLATAEVEVLPLRLRGPTPEKVRIRAGGQSLLRLDHGGPPSPVSPPGDRVRGTLLAAGGVLVADYGRGVAAQPDLRAWLQDTTARVPVVWDPHPLGAEVIPNVGLATPNQTEAARLAPEPGSGLATVARQAAILAERWSATAVAITLGDHGAVVAGQEGSPLVVPTEPAHADSCGAGDFFAMTATRALAAGALPSEAAEEAVRAASAFVTAGGVQAAWRRLVEGTDIPTASGPPSNGRPDVLHPEQDQESHAGLVAREVRRSGGVIVATGGCFDLLHAGHVSLLRSARSLGDCLIVCLNSDASISRLKGASRPVQSQDDRVAVLLALDAVDAVAVFDEDTPVAVLERLRPDLFVKGADYTVPDLPEAQALARWGGQTVLLPYLRGRSTTQLVQEASSHGP